MVIFELVWKMIDFTNTLGRKYAIIGVKTAIVTAVVLFLLFTKTI